MSLQPLTNGVSWKPGFWGDRFQQCEQEMIQELEKAFLIPENGAYLLNFRNVVASRDGSNDISFYGTDWSDGDCYKWIEAVAIVYNVSRNSQLKALMDKYIPDITAAQEADGYICTQIQLTERKPWEELKNHELYNFGHLFTAACQHHRATGERSLLNVAIKACDYLYGVFSPRSPQLANFGFNPSQIMGCVDLYRTTGQQKYLELADIFVSMRGSGVPGIGGDFGGIDQTQGRVPLREEYEAVGHSVTGTYLWAGATDLVMENGDAGLRQALLRLWQNVVSRKIYVTGGVAPCYLGLSSRLDKIHEAFACEYELPNRRGYNETCANIGFGMWAQRMLHLEGDGQFADMLELVLYNAGLSGGNLEGTRFFYANPLSKRQFPLWRSQDGQPVEKIHTDYIVGVLDHQAKKRWFTHSCVCCPPQYVRTIARVREWLSSVAERSLYIHLYDSCQITGELPGYGAVQVNIDTSYPWDGNIQLIIKQGTGSWALRLRHPSWCQNAKIKINGSELEFEVQNGYWVLQRDWHEGDKVELLLDMPPLYVEANPLVEEASARLCIKRGPLVYCLESDDLPKGIQIDDVALSLDSSLLVEKQEDLLGGVNVIKTKGKFRHKGDIWKEQLYLPLNRQWEELELTLIPYYAWANRSDGEMSVWLPVF